ncbi:MAG: YncE family protein [Bacteroidales bacterium]
MKKAVVIFGLLICFGMSYSIAQTNQAKYKIANKINLEGDGGWDYLTVDDSTSRLFISHGTMVQVLDLNTHKLIGTIPDTKGVHGIALARDLNKGFISCGRDSSVTVFNLKTLEFISKVKVTGANPDAILYDPFSQKVFVYNGRSSNATVIDAKTEKVIETIPLPGKPEFSVTNLKGKVYVNIEDKSEICQIDATTLKLEQTWLIAPGEEPTGLAIDLKNHQLFSVCDKLMVAVSTDNGKVVGSAAIGNNVDGVAFDPILNRIYTSNGEGTMTIIQPMENNKFRVLENLTTQKGARTIALNYKTHNIYLPTAEFGETPAPTAENQHPRPSVKPNTFTILEITMQ